jgi:ATP-dependent DNA helicase RecG
MDQKNVNLLIREGEGLTVELKERYTSRIDQDLVAFANTRGGTLLLGVSDHGEVTGAKLTNDLKARINSLARHCKPGLHVETRQVGSVVAVLVPEGGNKPYNCASGYYRRLDGSTQKMNHEELRLMFAENDPLPFEDRTARGFTFDDISKAKVRAFTREADIRIGRIPVADVLRSLNVADETRVKNAGILFFAKEVGRHLSQSLLTCVAFEGTDRVTIYDRIDVRDDLLTQFNEAMTFLRKHLNVRSEIRGVNRYDICEIPLEAIREGMVNALMHRDYAFRGTQISVEVYDDRVEIVNPGGLPRGVTGQNFGRVSIRRNQVIADLFFRLHKCERAGSGIGRMRKALSAAGLKGPRFDPDDHFFRIIFDRPEHKGRQDETSDVARSADGPAALELALKTALKTALKSTVKTAAAIMDAMKQNPAITVPDIARTVSVSARTANNHIRRLKDAGLIRRVGPAKGGHWEVLIP